MKRWSVTVFVALVGIPLVGRADTFELVKSSFSGGGAGYATVNGSGSIYSPTSGGNPGSYWRTALTVDPADPGIDGWFIAYDYDLALTFDPSAHGGIRGIDYSEDSKMFSGDAAGLSSGLVILQGSGRYFLRSPLTVNQSDWTTQTLANLQPTDFYWFTGQGFQSQYNPDFSPDADPMFFGVYRRLDLSNGIGRTVDAGIDNLRIAIRCVPEPASGGLAGIGVTALVVASVRRRRCRPAAAA